MEKEKEGGVRLQREGESQEEDGETDETYLESRLQAGQTTSFRWLLQQVKRQDLRELQGISTRTRKVRFSV
eukprot:g73013.t1